jgi:hypothetical protein
MVNERESATEEIEMTDMRMRTRIGVKRIRIKTGEMTIKDLERDLGADLDLDQMVSEEKREGKVMMAIEQEIKIRIEREIDMILGM